VPADEHVLLFAVDRRTITDPEHPVLVVELGPDEGYARSFRVVPHLVQDVENNLSIANLDWEDYVDAVGADGILRSFDGAKGDDSDED
jgi:hypothetical protein